MVGHGENERTVADSLPGRQDGYGVAPVILGILHVGDTHAMAVAVAQGLLQQAALMANYQGHVGNSGLAHRVQGVVNNPLSVDLQQRLVPNVVFTKAGTIPRR